MKWKGVMACDVSPVAMFVFQYVTVLCTFLDLCWWSQWQQQCLQWVQVRCSPKVRSSPVSPAQSSPAPSPPSISQSTMERVTIRAARLFQLLNAPQPDGLKQHNLPPRPKFGWLRPGIGLPMPSLQLRACRRLFYWSTKAHSVWQSTASSCVSEDHKHKSLLYQ